MAKEKYSPEDVVSQYANQLEERFDSVVIICTYRKDGETTLVYGYRGNTFATIGACMRFVEIVTENNSQEDEGDDDDNESWKK